MWYSSNSFHFDILYLPFPPKSFVCLFLCLSVYICVHLYLCQYVLSLYLHVCVYVCAHCSSLPNCVNSYRDLVTCCQLGKQLTQLLHQLTAEAKFPIGNSQQFLCQPSCLHNIPHNCTLFAQLSA